MLYVRTYIYTKGHPVGIVWRWILAGGRLYNFVGGVVLSWAFFYISRMKKAIAVKVESKTAINLN